MWLVPAKSCKCEYVYLPCIWIGCLVSFMIFSAWRKSKTYAASASHTEILCADPVASGTLDETTRRSQVPFEVVALPSPIGTQPDSQGGFKGVLSKCQLSSDQVPRPLLLCLPSPWLEPLSSLARCGCAIHLPVRDVPMRKNHRPVIKNNDTPYMTPKWIASKYVKTCLKHVKTCLKHVKSCFLAGVLSSSLVAEKIVTTKAPFRSKLRMVKSLLPLQAFRTGKSCRSTESGRGGGRDYVTEWSYTYFIYIVYIYIYVYIYILCYMFILSYTYYRYIIDIL